MKIWFQIAADTVGTAADAASTNPITRLLVNFHVDTERFVAQVLAILIVFVALWLFASKPILKTMDERRKKISDGLEYAEEMKQKLAEAEKRQAEIMKEAALEAKRISESRDFWEATEVVRLMNSAGFADKMVTPDVGLFISRVDAGIASRMKKAQASTRNPSRSHVNL